VIALGPSQDSVITISNTDRRLQDVRISLEADTSGRWLAVADDRSQWGAYALSAVQECLERFFPQASESAPGGMNWLVTGNLPQGAGLSVSLAPASQN
jgi:galactokinase